jgi:hypothetical protein
MKEFDESKYYLGTLCKRGHDYEGTGKSLYRGRPEYRCVECGRERDQRWKKNHPEYMIRYREEHKEEIRAKNREYEQAHRGKRKKQRRDRKRIDPLYDKEYRNKNRDRINAYCRARNRKQIKDLHDTYVKHAIRNTYGIKFRDVPQELVELKYIQLKAMRASRAYKKGELPCQKTS